MPIKDSEVRKASAVILIALLVFLSYLVVKPILAWMLTGLILAYIFNPIHTRSKKVFREKNISALATSILLVLVIFIPLWFLIPLAIQQVFDVFTYTQTVDIAGIIETIIPTSSEGLKTTITSAVVNFAGDITSKFLSSMTDFLVNIPNLLFGIAVVLFVFFFALRDSDKLKKYVSEISPFKKDKEKVLVKQFKDQTYSIIYGYVIIGILQGIATGIGLFFFGVPRVLVLTGFAIIASILPMIGPWLIWVPAAIYLFATGSVGMAVGFSVYSIIIVSSIDNFLRPYAIAKRTKSSSVIILIGMIGGLLVFGMLGLILGPLILSYLVLFMDAYKNKTLAEMFSSG